MYLEYLSKFVLYVLTISGDSYHVPGFKPPKDVLVQIFRNIIVVYLPILSNRNHCDVPNLFASGDTGC